MSFQEIFAFVFAAAEGERTNDDASGVCCAGGLREE